MSQAQLSSTSTVLLIEADPSLRRLIMLGLCHSGLHAIEASSIQELPAADAQTFDLLIVDLDQGVKSDWSPLSTLHEQPHLATLPIVALSWESPSEDKQSRSTSLLPFLTLLPRRDSALCLSVGRTCLPTDALCPPVGNITYLSKPFDARVLHNVITKLLTERAAQKAAQLAQVEAQVLASYEQQHAAPSIWPILTAAGLLLMVTGLLFHILIILLGVALVLISLLLWTLGTKPAPYVPSSTVAPAPVAN